MRIKCGKCGERFYIDDDDNVACPNCGKVASGPNASNCFIATAAYGTPLSEEIQILRNWRDNYLMKNDLGNFFVKVYYWFSPPIANIIRNNDNLRKLTRTILNPIVKYFKKKIE